MVIGLQTNSDLVKHGAEATARGLGVVCVLSQAPGSLQVCAESGGFRARDDGLVSLRHLGVEPEQSSGLRFLLWVFHEAEGISWQEPPRYLSGPVGRGIGNTARYRSPDNAGVLLRGWCWQKRKKKQKRFFGICTFRPEDCVCMYVMIITGVGEERGERNKSKW